MSLFFFLVHMMEAQFVFIALDLHVLWSLFIIRLRWWCEPS